MSERSQGQPMEIVIATTSAERAEWMKGHYVGHTMSGEALEQRPAVQCTSAADFLDAALKIYDITAIRLATSTQYPPLVDVIATYQPHIFHCEACGATCSDYPGWLRGLYGSARHSWCSEHCRKRIQMRLDEEIQEFRRVTFGNSPIEAVVTILCKAPLGAGLPETVRNALTREEFDEAVRQWRARFRSAERELVTILQSICQIEAGRRGTDER